MEDLIDRQAVLNATSTTLRITGKENAETVYGYIKKLCDDIKALPSAQPERKTGRWIPDGSELGKKCNKCGKSFSNYVNAGTGYVFLEEIPNFCPNCGADMRGELNE